MTTKREVHPIVCIVCGGSNGMHTDNCKPISMHEEHPPKIHEERTVMIPPVRESYVENKEMVNHPQHYGGDTIYETIKVIFAWGLNENFNLANAVKYISRAGKKGDKLEDLKKARFYLDYEIKMMEKIK